MKKKDDPYAELCHFDWNQFDQAQQKPEELEDFWLENWMDVREKRKRDSILTILTLLLEFWCFACFLLHHTCGFVPNRTTYLLTMIVSLVIAEIFASLKMAVASHDYHASILTVLLYLYFAVANAVCAIGAVWML